VQDLKSQIRIKTSKNFIGNDVLRGRNVLVFLFNLPGSRLEAGAPSSVCQSAFYPQDKVPLLTAANFL